MCFSRAFRFVTIFQVFPAGEVLFNILIKLYLRVVLGRVLDAFRSIANFQLHVRMVSHCGCVQYFRTRGRRRVYFFSLVMPLWPWFMSTERAKDLSSQRKKKRAKMNGWNPMVVSCVKSCTAMTFIG